MRFSPVGSVNNRVLFSAGEASLQQRAHSLSNDLQSHFPNSSCSPVKQSANSQGQDLQNNTDVVLGAHSLLYMRLSLLDFPTFKIP